MSQSDALHQEIEQARAEVSATVHDLAERLDVPKQVRKRVDRGVSSSVSAARSHPAMIVAIMAGAGTLIVLLVRRGRG